MIVEPIFYCIFLYKSCFSSENLLKEFFYVIIQVSIFFTKYNYKKNPIINIAKSRALIATSCVGIILSKNDIPELIESSPDSF